VDKRLTQKSSAAFWSRFGTFTRKLADDGAVSPPPPAAPSGDIATFAQRVRAVLAERGSAAAGALYLINLDTVRQAFEAKRRWEHLADRVHNICRKTIARRLDEADLFHCLPGPIFLVVFARLQPDAAKAKCAMIAGEIGRLLSDLDPTLSGVTVGAAAAQLDKGDVAIDLIDLKAEAERRMAGGQVVRVLAEPGRETAEVEPNAFANPWLVDSTVAADEVPASPEWYYEPTPECPPDLSFVYLPLWHVKHRAIGTFLCLPTLPVLRSHKLVGDAIFAAAPPALICEFDLAILRKATGDLAGQLAGGRQAMLSFPVHFETLAHSTRRRRYMSACAELDDRLRQNLAIELVDLPEGAPAGRIAELLAYIRPFARILSVRTNLSQLQFDAISAAKVFSVGAALGRESLPESELFRRLNSFTQAANDAGLHTYAFELRTRSITTAALGAGFDYISGTMIGSIVDAPDAAYRFEFADLYAGLLG
jgi:hypothetical protein